MRLSSGEAPSQAVPGGKVEISGASDNPPIGEHGRKIRLVWVWHEIKRNLIPGGLIDLNSLGRLKVGRNIRRLAPLE